MIELWLCEYLEQCFPIITRRRLADDVLHRFAVVLLVLVRNVKHVDLNNNLF